MERGRECISGGFPSAQKGQGKRESALHPQRVAEQKPGSECQKQPIESLQETGRVCHKGAQQDPGRGALIIGDRQRRKHSPQGVGNFVGKGDHTGSYGRRYDVDLVDGVVHATD